MPQPLVTLLTPCYNTGKYLPRLLDSVLNQTYPNIEMLVVDDGSQDNSKAVVEDYISLFKKKGYTLNYYYQENSGQSTAIQSAIKYVNGKYFAWPDSDDFYATNDAIEKMVSALENSSEEFAMVRCQEQLLDENDFHKVGLNGANVKLYEDKDLFEDCLFVKNRFFFPPGAYMVDFQKLQSSAEWPMYTSKNAGQNWQLMLPILWNYRCTSIPEVLYSVLVRAASHSRGQYSGYERIISKINAYSETIIVTLDKIRNMPLEIRDEYKGRIKEKYEIESLSLAFKYGKKEDFKKYYSELKKHTLLQRMMKISISIGCSKIFCRVIEFSRFVRRKVLCF